MLVLLMQFLWRYISDLVGKGIDVSVLAEFFLYSSASLVPMALPLAILLASLMTFGNLGENFELMAMKSSGVSLFRIMLPLIIFIAVVSVSAFFFSNNVLPKAQAKFWALMFSLRNKSPEVEIPSGEFYNGIQGYHIYVGNKDGKWLKDMMIYDFSSGFNNTSVTIADTGQLQFTADKKYLKIVLSNGEYFENLKNQRISYSSRSIPYRRETFKKKEMLIDFNSDFKRYDESVMKDQYVSKNITQLTASIDTMKREVEKQNIVRAMTAVQQNYFGRERTSGSKIEINGKNADLAGYNPDSAFLKMKYTEKKQIAENALSLARQKQENIKYNTMIENEKLQLRRHEIEWHRKFSLSFACLIFLFIGAPLGAIIRKGGLGMPVVISVMMFIFYYIIDNTGYKLARDGLWDVWHGMWLSSFVLLPIGIFLTYKAAKDSEIFRSEVYVKVILVVYNIFVLFAGNGNFIIFKKKEAKNLQ
jgi:lipopolysaccharide export system permease protein